MISIYDGNNFYRRLLETDPTGLAPRSVLTKALSHPNPLIWVWDGAHGNRRRREIYSGYKLNRGPMKKDIFAGFDTVQRVLTHTPAIQVEVPGYEADDVIAALTRRFASGGEHVEIYSNDLDLMQLSDQFPGWVFSGARPKSNVPLNLIPYYKVTVGDNSDNIPGIPGFGEKAWNEVDKDALVAWVDAIVAGEDPPVIELPKRAKPDPSMIRRFWMIVSFFDVPAELIDQNMKIGVPNYAAADTYLKEFFL